MFASAGGRSGAGMDPPGPAQSSPARASYSTQNAPIALVMQLHDPPFGNFLRSQRHPRSQRPADLRRRFPALSCYPLPAPSARA
jgi:hypothetical protein